MTKKRKTRRRYKEDKDKHVGGGVKIRKRGWMRGETSTKVKVGKEVDKNKDIERR